MGEDRQSAGDPIPADCEVIQIRVGDLNQLFNAIDPAPFRERDLDPNAEEFIVGWARDAHHKNLALLVHLDRPADLAEDSAILRDAIRKYFAHRADASRRKLRQLLRVGRTSLSIGLIVLALSVLAGGAVESPFRGRRIGEILRESLLIGGWVAMWRPLEIFLYDWWPIRAEARLFERLSAMPVRIARAEESGKDPRRDSAID